MIHSRLFYLGSCREKSVPDDHLNASVELLVFGGVVGDDRLALTVTARLDHGGGDVIFIGLEQVLTHYLGTAL